jgi:4-hydroxybenzoate polyprenyltransferase
MKGVDGNFLSLLKSTRAKRIFPVLIVMLLPSAYLSEFSYEVLFLMLISFFIYSGSSIFNAYKDKDYPLPRYFPYIIFLCFFISFILSLFHIALFFSWISWILLGFFYNTISRKILLGDGIVVGFTHYLIPVFSSSIILGISWDILIPLSFLSYLIGFFMIPVTNLKDIEGDIKRGYKTLVNSVCFPYFVSFFFFTLTFVVIFLIYFLLSFNFLTYFFIPFLVLLYLLVVFHIFQKRGEEALNYMRLFFISSFNFLIIFLSLNLEIILLSFFISFSYLFLMFYDLFKNK